MKPLTEILDVPLETRLFQLPEETGMSWDEMNERLAKQYTSEVPRFLISQTQLDNLNANALPHYRTLWGLLNKISRATGLRTVVLCDENNHGLVSQYLTDGDTYVTSSLRSYFSAQNITAKNLQTITGKSKTMASRLVRGERNISPQMMESIIPKVNLHFAYFVEKGYY